MGFVPLVNQFLQWHSQVFLAKSSEHLLATPTFAKAKRRESPTVKGADPDLDLHPMKPTCLAFLSGLGFRLLGLGFGV